MSSRTRFPEIFAELAQPFDPSEVKSYTVGGKKLFFITARSAMNRFDTVLGPENWKDSYSETEKGIKCKLEIRLPGEPEWIAKEDGGSQAGMPDPDNDEKSGYSSAFKRAGVKWGVGRYLYRDGTPNYGETPSNGHSHTPEYQAEPTQQPQRSENGHGIPRTGRALFAWTKEQEQNNDVGLLKYLNSWAKLQDFPGRMVDWDDDQVKLAYDEAIRKLQFIGAGNAEPEPATSTHQAPETLPIPDPNGPIKRPANGKELADSALKAQQDYGVTIVRPMIEWARANGIQGQPVSWVGPDLFNAWSFVAAKVAELAKPKADKADPANMEVWRKATKLLQMVYRIDTKPAPEAVVSEINRVYGSIWKGEVLEGSFREYRESDRLAKLAKVFDELLEEQANEPSNL